jgi:hypothetical protein
MDAMIRPCSASLLALALTCAAPAAAQTPPPPADPAPPVAPVPPREWRGELGGALAGSVYSIDYPAVSAHGNRAQGTAGLTYYPRPVREDGTSPLTLLPFFQHASTVSLSVGGHGWVTRPPPGSSGDRSSRGLAVTPSADVYLTRFLVLGVGLSYGYEALQTPGESHQGHGFGARAGLGLHLADTRFDLIYSFSAQQVDGAFAPLEWGSLGFSLFSVFARTVSLGLSGNVNARGGGAGASVNYHPARDIGLFLSGGASWGRYDNGPSYGSYGVSPGLAGWISDSFRLGGSYRLQLTHLPTQSVGGATYGYDQLEHTLELNALLRF